ncbi:hypothetical protein GBA52_012717 [Prunus armeniaca]|nr:hypothetical protein GBA52_012717 [Prunus armeniaca]
MLCHLPNLPKAISLLLAQTNLPLEFNKFKQKKTQRNQWFLTVASMDAIKKVMQTGRSTMIKLKVLPWVFVVDVKLDGNLN